MFFYKKNTFCRYKQTAISCVIPLMLFTDMNEQNIGLRGSITNHIETKHNKNSVRVIPGPGTSMANKNLYTRACGNLQDSDRLLSSCSSVFCAFLKPR